MWFKMILFYADAHTYFDMLLTAYKRRKEDIEAVFLLGDQCPETDLQTILKEIDCPVKFILGNHDADRDYWLENHFSVWHSHLHCNVFEINGIRVTGLSGVFREKIWHPGYAKVWETRQELIDYQKMRREKGFCGWLPRKHWCSIFPEDFNKLLDIETDILITHEAPDTYKYGFSIINELVELLGAKILIHGHHHVSYTAYTKQGIKVIGLGKKESFYLDYKNLLDANSSYEVSRSGGKEINIRKDSYKL